MDANEKLEKDLEELFYLYTFLELVGYSPEQIEQLKDSKRAEYIEFHTRPDVEVIEKPTGGILDDDILLEDLPYDNIEEELFERYQRLALSIGGKYKKYYNPSLWEDIDQVALLSIFLAIKSYNPTTERQTIARYITVCVKNNVIDFVYRRKDDAGVSVEMHSIDKVIKSASDSGLSNEQIIEQVKIIKKRKINEEWISDAFHRFEIVSLESERQSGASPLNIIESPDPIPEWLNPDSGIVAALKTLKPPEYSVFCLYHELWCQVPVPVDLQVGGKFEGKTPTFLIVGDILGINISTVKKRYYSAHEKVIKYLDRKQV